MGYANKLIRYGDLQLKNNCDQINDLTHRIGSVRAWLKISLLIGFTLCIIIAIGQYVFTAQISELQASIESAQISELQASIESLHLQLKSIDEANKGLVEYSKQGK